MTVEYPQAALTYTGEAPLPRIVTGPVSKKHYLINPNKRTISVAAPDAAIFLQLTGEIRFQRG